MRRLIFGLLAVALAVVYLATALPAIAATPVEISSNTVDYAGDGDVEQLLQFTSGGHVLGFGSQGVYLAGLDHALRVEFAGGVPVQPIAEAGGTTQIGTAPLGLVTYTDVWSNIDIVYSSVDDGIADSTYIIHPGGDPADISLRYNVPVEVMPGGGLRFSFDSGYVTEGAPVAWQLVDGERLPVAVQFRQQAEDRVGLDLGSYDAGNTVHIDPVYQWHTFHGSSSGDIGGGIAVDSSGNVYVAGYSNAAWGTPLNAHNGSMDIVVVKLNGSGAYQWHTFYGSSSEEDWGQGIAVDPSGDIYVTGYSDAAWGFPLNAYAGGGYHDIVVVKLNGSGALQWHTFHGSAGKSDAGYGIAVDPSGDIYVTGYSAAWGSPLNAHNSSNSDIFIAKLNGSGALQWHTFYGSSDWDNLWGSGIAVDPSGDIYVTGHSWASWNGPGSTPPINAFNGSGGFDMGDIAVVKLNSSGTYQWHTFYGSSSDDIGYGIAVNPSGNVYVTGYSDATWGSPLNTHAGGGYHDIVVVKLNGSGDLQWHTFYGSSGEKDLAYGIAVDPSDSVYVTGYSGDWGSPLNDHNGSTDIAVVKLNSSGTLQWHTFYGSSDSDNLANSGIAVDPSGYIYMTGESSAWGSPINAHADLYDIVVIKAASVPFPTPTPTATSSATPTETGTATVTPPTPVSYTHLTLPTN